MPAEPRILGEESADERRQERAEIEAAVEDREAGVASRITVGVQLPHHRRDVRLEKSSADHDGDQAGVKKRHVVHSQQEVADGDDHAADDE